MTTLTKKIADAKGSSSPNYKWHLVGMLWLISFFNYADRNTLSAVMPHVKAEFSLNNFELGLLTSSFLWVYALAAAPAGWLGDRFGYKRVILSGLVLWSLVTFLTPFAGGLMGFVILRALTGLGEASYYPSGTAMIGKFHSSETRARALSIHQTAVFAGGGIGAYIAALLAQHFNWHMPFFAYGLLGIVLAVVLYFKMHDTPPKKISKGKVNAEQRNTLKIVLATRSAVMLCFVFFLATFVTVGITTWAPTFFNLELKLPLAEASAYGAVTLAVAGFLAVLCSGVLADWAIKRSPNARFYVLAAGLFFAFLSLLPFGQFRTPSILGSLLLISGFFKGIFDGSIYAAMHDVVPAHARATAVGIMTTIGFAGAGLAPIVVGAVSDHIGLGEAIAATSALYLIATLILVGFRAQIRRDVFSARQSEAD